MKFIISIFSIFFITSCCNQTINHKENRIKVKKNIVVISKQKSNIDKKTFQSIPVLKRIAKSFSKSGWKRIGISKIPAISKKTPFLGAFESPEGSIIFMTKYKILDSIPRSSDYINSITDISIFNKAFHLYSPAKSEIKNHSNGTRVLHQYLIGNGTGKTLYTRNGIPTRFEAAYIPLQFSNKLYSTLIVDFRGKKTATEDYQQFLQYIDNLKLPPNVKPLL